MSSSALALGGILAKLSEFSRRPRQTFIILNLIAEIAGPDGRAGPWVTVDGQNVPVRDWLGFQLTPLTANSPRRQQLRSRLRSALKYELPNDPEAAEQMIECAVKERILKTNKTVVSRAVTDLEAAGLITRQYKGYLRPHVNRGAQRHAVYVITAETRAALHRGTLLV